MKSTRLATLLCALVLSTASAFAAGDVSGARLVFPNPFTEGCTFTLSMPNAGKVKIVVYDLLGRQVADLTERMGRNEFPSGSHDIPWDGTDQHGDPVPAGTYICVLWSSEGAVVNSVKVVKVMGIN
jgi:flagellar hook assembly protein FlgD